MQTIRSLNIGPVIGRVTHDSARILAEFNFTAEIHCHIVDDNKNSFQVISMAIANRPIVFRFEGLSPETRYRVLFEPPINQVPSSFRTLKKVPDGNLRIAVVSCNEGDIAHEKDRISDLWADIAEKGKKGQLDYAFHIGDQVYLDMGVDENSQPYQQSVKLLYQIPKTQWHMYKENICEAIRGKYRKTWSHRPTQEALANVPNMTILDDHEVRDDFGWRTEDFNPNTTKPDLFYAQCAREVYYEYQRALRDDNTVEQADCEYWADVINGVGIVALEYRGVRTWQRGTSQIENSQLGKKQLQFFKSLFADNGTFDNCKSVLVLSPLAFIVFEDKIVKTGVNMVDDLQESWNYTDAGKSELALVLDIMREWKLKKKKKGREITLIGGDIHTGGHTEIFYKGKPIFKQVISSAINQKRPKMHEDMILKILKGLGHDMTTNYRFKHHDFTRYNNYGIVRVLHDEKQDVHESYLVAANNGEKVQDLEYHSSLIFRKTDDGCCNIF